MQTDKRAEKIKKHRADIPRSYRRIYDEATAGKSLRAAINSQCLECQGWQISAIKNCEAFACPLWAVKPYQEISQNTRQCRSTKQGLKNAGLRVSKEVRT